jgi:beta-lactam-binding protein with PASTA domain
LASNVRSDSSNRVAVPTVVNLPLDQAEAQLRSAGFIPEPHNAPNDKVAPGLVTDQDPKGNEQAEKGSVVRLTVSGGVAQVEVPALLGLTEAAARSLLENDGLLANIQQKNDEEAPKGTVIDQDPKSGTNVDKGSTVNVVVSAGKSTVLVPDVSGQSSVTAVNTLTQAGFKPIQRSEPSDSVPAGRVITTQPGPGTQVPPGASITVVVSSGPPPSTTTPTTAAPSTTATTAAPSTTSTSKPPASSSTSSSATSTSSSTPSP